LVIPLPLRVVPLCIVVPAFAHPAAPGTSSRRPAHPGECKGDAISSRED
jgi:hypothetical protein